MSSAQVHAVQRLADFKAALQTFADRGKDAMSASAMEIRHAQDWLEAQAGHWKAEIRRAEEAVHTAKTELTRKKMMKIGDRHLDTTDQEKALRKAEARLEYAEEKRAKVTAWMRQLPEAIEEYHGQAKPFQDVLEHDLSKMVTFLEHKIAALEEYQRIQSSAGDAG